MSLAMVAIMPELCQADDLDARPGKAEGDSEIVSPS